MSRFLSFQFEGEGASRLDKFLVTCLPEFSRSRLQNLIENGFILVDGIVAHKSGQMINRGNLIQVHIPATRADRASP